MAELPIIETPTHSQKRDLSSEPSRGRYAFVSLGCPKNLVDSEKMLGHLALEGYTLVSEPRDADFVIVNTCGFIESAREESRGVIREMVELKQRGDIQGIIVAGCLAERLGTALLDEIPDVDHIVGVFGRDEISRVADRWVGGINEQRELFRPAPMKAMDDRARLRITPSHFAYLKISEGCDRTCTFCAIPKMRGPHVSKPIEMVVDEARELAEDGVRELILVAQDTTYYGLDLYGEARLDALLAELETIESLAWIRLMYLYPIHFSDALIERIAKSTKILPYLDMPLQHASDVVLRRMQRRVRRADMVALLRKLRQSIPNLVLRTTLLTGFPGETEGQFEELKDFVREFEFQRMGAFSYSMEPGTPAERLDGHLPSRVKERRRDELMEIQQEVAFRFGDSLVGYELDVLIDEPLEDDLWLGRIYADAPEIDGNVFVTGSEIQAGELVPVEILGRRDYDLIGVRVEEAEIEA